MAVTILNERVRIAGNKGIALQNSVQNIFRLYSAGAIAGADTGTLTVDFKPILDANGIPVIIGLPFGINATFAASVITFTAVGISTAVAFATALNVKIVILGAK